MAKRSIIWTDTAARQRREILKYWTIRNKSDKYARKLIELTKNRINIILKHPESGMSADFSETRVSAMGHFSIYYRLTEKAIYIMAFWDNRKDPKILLGLINKK